MKKIFFVFSVLTIVALSALTAFAIEGDGTEETPFLITDQGELELVTDFPDCHFKLANDIELEGTWIPLCKQTSSGTFTGVFDGAGYTISNLTTDGSVGGLFKHNSGIIKNLNVIIADEGMTGSAAIVSANSGTVSNCVVKGNIMSSFDNIGGICSYNSNMVKECKFEGNIENTYNSGHIGGISGKNDSSASIVQCAVLANISGKYYAGGISGDNDGTVTACYFMGEISSGSSYKGGIAGYNDHPTSYAYSKIIDCYAVPKFNSGGYGIAYNGSDGSITTSYYDKTISGLSDTSTGTPKSTAAMKMKQTYSKNWDFDTVWGIDKNIKNGYPYLLWEYPNVEDENPYTVNSLKLTDLSGNELEEIPNESFYFEINVTKNDHSKNADSLIIALYDENGAFIDLKYMSGTYYQNQSMTFGTMINKTDKKIAKVKAFVWDSLFGMKPLSNEMVVAN